MIKQCFEKPPRFLLIDEIEDLRQSEFLPRFALLEIKPYTFEEFKRITLEVLHHNPLAEYIADQAWTSTNQPNLRDCVRIEALARTEQDVLRVLRVIK